MRPGPSRKTPARPLEPLLERRFADAEGLGRLPNGASLEVVECEDLAVGGFEPGEGFVQDFAALVACGGVSGGGATEGRGLFREAVSEPPAVGFGTAPLAAQIDRNGLDPGSEPGGIAQLVQFFVCGDECVLSHIFGVARTAQLPADQGHYGRPEEFDELAVLLPVPTANAADDPLYLSHGATPSHVAPSVCHHTLMFRGRGKP